MSHRVNFSAVEERSLVAPIDEIRRAFDRRRLRRLFGEADRVTSTIRTSLVGDGYTVEFIPLFAERAVYEDTIFGRVNTHDKIMQIDDRLNPVTRLNVLLHEAAHAVHAKLRPDDFPVFTFSDIVGGRANEIMAMQEFVATDVERFFSTALEINDPVYSVITRGKEADIRSGVPSDIRERMGVDEIVDMVITDMIPVVEGV